MPDIAAAVAALAADESVVSSSDDELIRGASAGLAGAREELARRYRGPAYVLALQLLGNRDDALDVAQEAMLRFFATLGRLTPGRSVRPWLLTIVRNQARDLWRRQRVRRTEPIDGSGEGLAAELVVLVPNPEETAGREELRRRVWSALSRLSEGQREIVVLRDFHGLSYEEIAHVLDIKVGTVMSRLHAARTQLRARLSADGHHA
jgi:RNA polymerase sigma-70 factor (ECF subfamily)